MHQPAMTEPNHEKCLTKLREIKSELDQLRENRTVYIRSEDVFRLYQSLHEQIRACDHFDKDQDEDEEGKSQG